jgi:Ca2+/Na+ antiporter
MYIVAIAWIYVVLMMSITEYSVIAGIMTFLLYCVFPLTIVLYLMRTPQRKRERLEKQAALQKQKAATATSTDSSEPESLP